ncbi:Gfo/Idh/MocA family protein [Paenibacillus albus]|uniref:Gfo/Idh/MocA family oxidoreductase n=1 Tax=Paenibacillus albus TaxID=2495582 RepID=A0A3Q8X8V3_9BACL|nr:Gfo/Idh/MocA family oxidoreductase [Paenibacillus albus]AZN43125.1 Gfo/Idh/MocA family oxidoreductase [Paenibacillus albus]
MSERNMRIAGIGCGPMGALHYSMIGKIPGLELIALCDIDKNKLSQLADSLGVERKFTDITQMLDEIIPDAVAVIGPPALHILVAEACLERQIPFLCEKPISLTTEDALRLERLADKYGDCGQVGYTSRYSPAQRLAKNVSRSAEFGKISYVATTHLTCSNLGTTSFWGTATRAEGLIHAHGVHAIDLWRFLGGDPLTVSASVTGDRADSNDGFISVLAYVQTADGPHGIIHIKESASHNGDINSDIMGEYSRVCVEDNKNVRYERYGGRDGDWVRNAMANDVLGNGNDIVLPDQPIGYFMGHGLQSQTYEDYFRFEWIAFAQSIRSGKPFAPSVKEGCKTVYLTNAIIESIKKGGQPISVSYS